MTERRRFNIIVLLGLLLWGLILHDLHSFRFRIILKQESISYFLNRLPIHSLFTLSLLVLALVLLIVTIFLLGNKLFTRYLRQKPWRVINTIFAGTALFVALFVVSKYPYEPIPQEWSGALAFFAGISLVLFTLITSGRPLVATHLIVLLLFLLAAVVPIILPAHREKVRMLDRLMETADSSIEKKRQEASQVDPLNIINEAKKRAEENSIYRFDEHIDNAEIIKAPEQGRDEEALFEVPAKGKFIAPRTSGLGYDISSEGQVFPDYRGRTALRIDRPLDLDPSLIGAFRVVLRVSSGNYFQVFWSNDEKLDRSHGIRIPLAPPAKMATYEIKEMLTRFRSEKRLNYVWVIPSDRDAKVEIASFKILNRLEAASHGLPVSVGYEKLNDEIRKAILVSTPSEIRYSVKVPKAKPRLIFGLGILNDSVPASFQVSIGSSGRERIVFSKVIASNKLWEDNEVDLTNWAGSEVDIKFKTHSDSRNLGLWSNPILLGEAASTPNIVIFLVDCLRADHLSAYGYSRPTSPVFDSLATEGALFERAFSNGTHTKHSIPGIFSSNPLSSTGIRHLVDILPDEFPTMPEILRSMGYATAAFTMNYYAGPFSGTHQGFCRIFGVTRMVREAGRQGTPLDSEVLISHFLEKWIRERSDRNFFLYIHTMDVHGVYDPPEKYRNFFKSVQSRTSVSRNRVLDPKWLSSPSRESRVALYDGEIEYGDAYLGRFINMLRTAGVLENTIIMVTADHGEYLGEHRMWAHDPPAFIQGTHIPLLIVGPGVPRGLRVSERVQTFDMLPTVLDFIALTPDSLLFQGKSLLPLIRGQAGDDFKKRAIFVEGNFAGEMAMSLGKFHLITERNLIFDLSKDPEEHDYLNEFTLDFPLKRRARKLAKKYMKTFSEFHDVIAPAGEKALGVNPEALKRLRALGYIK